MSKRIAAIFDLDGTLVPGYAGVELIRYFFTRAAFKPRFMVFTPAVLAAFQMGLISRPTMVTLGATTFDGIPVRQIERGAQKSLNRSIKHRLFKEGIERVRWHQRQGHITVIASGSHLVITQTIADYLGMDLALGTQVEYEEGRATGRVIGRPVFGDDKARMIRSLMQKHDILWEQSYAYTNEVVDLTTLEMVGHPVAVNPDDELRAIARQRDWEICEWKQRVGRRR